MAEIRRLSAARAAWGTLLLAAPDGPVRALGLQPDEASRLVLRLLGSRHLVQAAVTAAVPTRLVVGTGAALDGAHAASGVLLAILSRRWRRGALADAALASAWAALGLRLRAHLL